MDAKTAFCNIPSSIESRIGRNLHLQPNHPIEIMKCHLFDYFKTLPDYDFKYIDNLSPFVSIEDNFDKLLIPSHHAARSKSDTYYVNETTVLRTHTSAHQNQLLSKGCENFLVVGDVYRKDECDKTHAPIFHQCEGIGKVPENMDAETELKRILNGLVEYLFPGCEYRINDDYFPFTKPSYEYEVMYNGKWMEILGCGIMHPIIVQNNNLEGQYWAWGIGLERLVMIKSQIPDIRYLWSTHPKFLNQYKNGMTIFKPYSELPSMFKDISFWIPNDKINEKWVDENDFFEMAREVMGDWIEQIKLMDEFVHPKKEITSRMYRITFSPIDPSLTDPAKFTEKCNTLQDQFRDRIKHLVTLR